MGKICQIVWNKGKKLSKIHKENLSISHKGLIPWNKENNYKICPICNIKFHIKSCQIGIAKFCSKECKNKFQIGKPTWNKGKKVPKLIGNKNGFKNGNHPKTEFKKGLIPWNFQNYKSREPYGRGWTNILKESIRLRDNYKCQICGVPQEECNEALIVHHKDTIKTNLEPNNLISLCRKCHISLHHKIFKEVARSIN